MMLPARRAAFRNENMVLISYGPGVNSARCRARGSDAARVLLRAGQSDLITCATRGAFGEFPGAGCLMDTFCPGVGQIPPIGRIWNRENAQRWAFWGLNQ
jgi:hypothetical protein